MHLFKNGQNMHLHMQMHNYPKPSNDLLEVDILCSTTVISKVPAFPPHSLLVQGCVVDSGGEVLAG